jgi:hypothetical protein
VNAFKNNKVTKQDLRGLAGESRAMFIGLSSGVTSHKKLKSSNVTKFEMNFIFARKRLYGIFANLTISIWMPYQLSKWAPD